MAVTLTGLQGTVSDTAMATQLPHHAPVAYSATDAQVTAVAGQRAVSVAPGSTLAGFMKRTSDAAETVAIPAPSSGGRWYAITIDRQWSPTNTAVLKADDLAVTNDGTLPNFPPAAAFTAAAALPNQPGTAGSTAGQRHILALAFVRAADTTTYYFDTRMIVTGNGMMAAPHFAALLLNGLRHFRDGAEVTVLRHGALSSGVHVLSTWRRESGYWVAVGPIEADGNSDALADSVMTDISTLAGLAMQTLALPAHADTRFLNRRTLIEWAWTSNGWAMWNTSGNAIDFLMQRDGDVNYDGPGANTATIRNGVLTMSFSLYSGNARGSNGRFATMRAGARPDGPPVWLTGECYDGNDFLSAMRVASDGTLAPTGPRTNSGQGYNAIRGSVSYRCS